MSQPDNQAPGWMITKDLIDDGQSKDVRSGGTATEEEILRYGKKFRMLDGDDEVYYEGLSIETDETDGFEPLDEFGMPNAGCTDIQYKNDFGHWTPL